MKHKYYAGYSITVLLLVGALIVAFLAYRQYILQERDITGLQLRPMDGAIAVTWNAEQMHRTDSIELIVLGKNHSETIELPAKDSEYLFQNGCYGEQYIFSARAKMTAGRKGKLFSDTCYFLRYEDENGLPTIVIETKDGEEPSFTPVYAPEGLLGVSIVDNSFVDGRCVVKNLSALPEEAADVKIRVRGNTSVAHREPNMKLPYKLRFAEAVDLFGSGKKERDFVLLADAGMDLKTYLGLRIAKLCGAVWTIESRYVNLVVNNDWKGLYLLTEAPMGDKLPDYVSDDGFVLEYDAYWWKEETYINTARSQGEMAYTVKYPEEDSVTERKLRELEDYLGVIEKSIYEHEALQFIDEDSFAAWILVRDLLGQEDAAGANIYYYVPHFDKENYRANQLMMGPLWDFDSSFLWVDSWSKQHSWLILFNWLFQDREFGVSYAEAWNAVKGSLLENINEELSNLNTELEAPLNTARKLDAMRWGGESFLSVREEGKARLNWLEERIAWIDQTIQSQERDTEDGKDYRKLRISRKDRMLYAVMLPGDACDGMKVAVWSEERGQDDLRWEAAKQNEDGDWEAELDLSLHPSDGIYRVDIYVVNGEGELFLEGDYLYRDPSDHEA